MRLGGTSKHIEENPSRTYVIVTVSCMWGIPNQPTITKQHACKNMRLLQIFVLTLILQRFYLQSGPTAWPKEASCEARTAAAMIRAIDRCCVMFGFVVYSILITHKGDNQLHQALYERKNDSLIHT